MLAPVFEEVSANSQTVS
ncbi:MAG: hypothetical protein ACLS4Z_07225 [Christensenellaceae bacterium]